MEGIHFEFIFIHEFLLSFCLLFLWRTNIGTFHCSSIMHFFLYFPLNIFPLFNIVLLTVLHILLCHLWWISSHLFNNFEFSDHFQQEYHMAFESGFFHSGGYGGFSFCDPKTPVYPVYLNPKPEWRGLWWQNLEDIFPYPDPVHDIKSFVFFSLSTLLRWRCSPLNVLVLWAYLF